MNRRTFLTHTAATMAGSAFGSSVLAQTVPAAHARPPSTPITGAEHVTVWREAGRYGGWPANHGIWNWGDEILVGFTAGVLKTDDCRKTYEELKANGVEFVQEPQDRFYGIEALMKDNSGNWFSMTQHKK